VRYYDITVTDPKGGSQLYRWTSLASPGVTNPGALNVEMDIYDAAMGFVDNNSYVTIWGVPLQNISVPDLNDKQITIKAGMAPGLPLAKPQQQGTLATAQIWQAFGNWINTDMTLNFILMAAAPSNVAPTNITVNWRAGTTMADALAATISQALPNAQQKITISPNLVVNYDVNHYTTSFQGLNDLVNDMSKRIINNPNYQGVLLYYNNGVFTATDGTAPTSGSSASVKQLFFEDLIGQPTWVRPNTISVKFVMRGDLKSTLMTVRLPPGLTQATAQSYLRFQDKTTFTGNFQVLTLRHVGNYRQPDAASWVTIAEMIPQIQGM
jgi:hypothetical protein